jgi:hypothetical protein
MIEITREIIPNDKKYLEYWDSDRGTSTVATEPYRQQSEVSEYLYSHGLEQCVKQINKSFDDELSWLIINRLSEVPPSVRILQEVEVDQFTTNSIIPLLLTYFQSRTGTLRIICSPETYSILRLAIMSDITVCGSFMFRDTFMSIPVNIENIPDNEIWIIDLNSWRLVMTLPENTVEFDAKRRRYIYTRSFRMAEPICVGDKLVRIKLTVKEVIDPKVVAMRELMDRMRLPLREPEVAISQPVGVLIRSGESVWLTGNPEEGLCITNVRSKDMRHKTIPQMFNPGAIAEPGKKKKKK